MEPREIPFDRMPNKVLSGFEKELIDQYAGHIYKTPFKRNLSDCSVEIRLVAVNTWGDSSVNNIESMVQIMLQKAQRFLGKEVTPVKIFDRAAYIPQSMFVGEIEYIFVPDILKDLVYRQIAGFSPHFNVDSKLGIHEMNFRYYGGVNP